MALRMLAVLAIVALCVLQVLCLPHPDLQEDLAGLETNINSTLGTWRENFENLFQETNQLDSLLAGLGHQLQTLSESIGNLTKNLEDSIQTTPAP